MNILSKEKQSELFRCFRDSYGIRASAIRVGVAKATAARYLKVWNAARGGEVQRCACGRNLGHKGWCRIRFARSHRRQEILKEMQYHQ